MTNTRSCLVIGGNGFVGSHLTRLLVKKGYLVRILDNFRSGVDNLQKIAADVEIVKGDFLNEANVITTLKGVDYLFHYVSTTVPATAVRDPIYDIQTNLVGTVRLLQLAATSGVRRVIFPSSGGTVYGEPVSLPVKETDSLNPIDPYGICKLAIENYLNHFWRAYGLDYLILRYSNLYGERQSPHGQQGVIPVFLNKIKMGDRPVVYGDGSMERDYLYVGDAVDATIAALEAKTQDKVFNVGSGKGTSVRELVDVISNVTGKAIQPLYVEDPIIRIHKTVLDISRMREQVGWKPTTGLWEGVGRTWNWIRGDAETEVV